MVLQLIWPVQIIPSAVAAPLGFLFILTAAALLVFALREMRKAATPVSTRRPTAVENRPAAATL